MRARGVRWTPPSRVLSAQRAIIHEQALAISQRPMPDELKTEATIDDDEPSSGAAAAATRLRSAQLELRVKINHVLCSMLCMCDMRTTVCKGEG